MGPAEGRGDTARAVAAVCLAVAIATSPVFIVGGLAVHLRADLDFTEAQLGVAASTYYAVSALAAMGAGRLTGRFSWRAVTDAGMVVTAAAMLAVALLAQAYLHLLVLLAASGLGAGLVAPTGNLAITRNVAPAARGAALGAKQAMVPAGVVIAGLGALAVEAGVDWRWVFAVPLAGLGYRLLLPRRDAYHEEGAGAGGDGGERSRWTIPAFAVAAGVGSGIAGALTAYYVESAVALGAEPSLAGALLAVGGVTGVGGRVLWGWLGDRGWVSPFVIVVALFVVGGAGTAALGWGGRAPVLAVATVAAFGLGWAWSGALFHGVVRLRPERPAGATGQVQGTMFLGGVIGPAAFGFGVEAAGFRPSWLVVGALLMGAGALVALAVRGERAAAG